MKNFILYLIFAGIVVVVSGCASTVTTPQETTTAATTTASGARRKRELEKIELDENFAVVSALTFLKFGNESENIKNADKVEEQLREFISIEQIKESKFGKYDRRMFRDETGYLRVVYTLSKGGKYCNELIQLAVKAIHLTENVANGKITCGGEVIDVPKLD